MRNHEALDGIVLTGCAVRRWNILALWGQGIDDPDPLSSRPTRIFFYYPDEPEAEQWAHRDIGSTRGIRGCGVHLPDERWVFVADDGEVYVVGGGDDGFEACIVDRPAVSFSNLRCVPRGRACAVEPRGKIHLRDGPDRWRPLSDGFLEPGLAGATYGAGLTDVGGFSEHDLYACGSAGDLWHFDGAIWSAVDLPSSVGLTRMCCSSNGRVTVFAGDGQLLVGRGESWQLLAPDAIGARFESIVEFEGRIIISTQTELFELIEARVVPASLGGPADAFLLFPRSERWRAARVREPGRLQL